ncbi:Molybdenum cofactor biosynthesis protein C, MoaC [Glarea lozoyensis ATCC 20868]|uniref:cyclic pyranopterin monophosphate synthase n=1 Tax=Glarea lozoyensis (strain ATCC 20868 / MF5171) TaxID=1116229 RepID=S3CUE4_GLAL2|nr:Molybdenum cofactor biosynthesis protein C, MoaC [Glarea lozoyensis ATCC 20868]EPE30032.1 Molybdenum cofactor biosynthesis protein C, MoaC [Glarea lozoyensis ATCC 20868]
MSGIRLYATQSSSPGSNSSQSEKEKATSYASDSKQASHRHGSPLEGAGVDNPSSKEAEKTILGAEMKSTASPATGSVLTHLNTSGNAHMVSITSKAPTSRKAIAVCSIHFSNPTALPLIRSNSMKKGDVLSVARIAGIMAAKKTSDLIPLCHPIAITHVSIDLEVKGGDRDHMASKPERVSTPWQGTGQGDAYPWHNHKQAKDDVKQEDFGRVNITATVTCDGKTGVEMEALTAASTASLTVYDMCKAVDKGMWIMDLRVVRKEGGKSGTWVESENVS